MSDVAGNLPQTVEELTPAWLTHALGQQHPDVVVREAEVTETI
jgi:hypothetical protein